MIGCSTILRFPRDPSCLNSRLLGYIATGYIEATVQAIEAPRIPVFLESSGRFDEHKP